MKTLSVSQEEPWGLAVSQDGKCLAVSDRETGRITRFDEEGRRLLSFITAEDAKPVALAFGPQGTLFAAAQGQRQILGFAPPVQSPVTAPGPETGKKGGFHAQALAAAPVEDVAVAIGQPGGSLRRLDKAGVEVPEGALGEAVSVGVYAPVGGEGPRNERAAAQGLSPAGPAVEFGPEGLAFDKPVTVALPYNGPPGGLAVQDRKSTRLNSSHIQKSRMPSSA